MQTVERKDPATYLSESVGRTDAAKTLAKVLKELMNIVSFEKREEAWLEA